MVVEGGEPHEEEGGGPLVGGERCEPLVEVGGGRLVEVGGGRRVVGGERREPLAEEGGGLHEAVDDGGGEGI